MFPRLEPRETQLSKAAEAGWAGTLIALEAAAVAGRAAAGSVDSRRAGGSREWATRSPGCRSGAEREGALPGERHPAPREPSVPGDPQGAVGGQRHALLVSVVPPAGALVPPELTTVCASLLKTSSAIRPRLPVPAEHYPGVELMKIFRTYCLKIK
jgi:hypothetical protein